MASIDIGISRDELTKLTKEAIREMVAENITEIMKNIDAKSVVERKVNESDKRIDKLVEQQVKNMMVDYKRRQENVFKEVAHKVILEEISKKPLSGNVYLKLVAQSASTDYGNEDW